MTRGASRRRTCTRRTFAISYHVRPLPSSSLLPSRLPPSLPPSTPPPKKEKIDPTLLAVRHKQVTPENLVVFSVRYNTPWKRIIYYDVPSALPSCPPDGCTCAWGWVPNGCGQPNMYHQAFKCRVSNAKSTVPVKVPAKAPVGCEGNEGGCVGGCKQMLYWNQAEGNNVEVEGRDRRGEFRSPGYNMGMGFRDGAQNGIFRGSAPASSSSSSSTSKPTSTQGAKANNAPTSTAAGSTSTGSSTSGGKAGGTTSGSNSLTGSSSSSSDTTSPAEAPKPISEKAQCPTSCQRKRRRAAAERR
ncbi:hypothetical protein D9611_011608 [Ephemerocybe angulata]|uniref:Uncharacterized protein n=1 Tax=Ephemerocybe angulata TaxID=980116 RepID=A0A8H5ET78_9AGAR|nr:hypothetical protein D9611_011608 [Tulosesus angulatus]